jgi:3-hydroxyacyl-CoA dehydrogenase/enoyl-CoA hydratase/3-hydroxybutyryl-CoA epimerase
LRAGVDARMRDTDVARVARGVLAARTVLDEAVKRHRLDRHERDRRILLVSGTTDYSGFHQRDLVIEAVFEDLAVKRGVLAEVEGVVTDECVVASNTSTLSIGRLQEGARHPERIVGMHFFSPVEKMPLVEVIGGEATAEWAMATAARFGQSIGKTVIVVRDAPGFWVNRLLGPYLNEAGWCLKEGASIEAIDKAMTRFGFPMGPFALLDEVGLDVAAKASAVLHEAIGERLGPAPALGALVREGRLGRKSGRGFYRYERGTRRSDESVAQIVGSPRNAGSAASVERRLVLALVNEAAHALAEGVVRSPRDGDIGALLGFGFPPFLGGPLRYIDDCGAAAIVAELEQHAARVGRRFAPADVLVTMARTGATFYGEGA